MSDQQPKNELDDLVREMKADRGPTPDWQAIDEKLFAKLEAERGKQVLTGVRKTFSPQGRRELGLEER